MSKAFLEQFNYVRVAGSSNEKKASELLCKSIKNGVIEPFTFDDTFSHGTLIINGHKIPSRTYTHSMDCKNLYGKGIYLEDLSKNVLDQASGKIVILNGVMNKESYEALEKANALGFITIYGSCLDPFEDLPSRVKLRGVKDAKLPGFMIHYNQALKILEEDCFEIGMSLENERKRIESQNVIGTLLGNEHTITLTAHYDSVADGVGAYDNLAACGIIRDVYQYFETHSHQCTLKCIFFGSEESGLKGSIAYTDQHIEELKNNHILNLNVDLAGQLIGGNVLGVTADQSLVEFLDQTMKERGIGVNLKHQIWSSDSNSFARYNVPALTLNRDGIGMHTRHDTLDLISDKAMKQASHILIEIIKAIDESSTIPYNISVPKVMLEQLNGK